jgi:spore coat protein JB
MIVSQKKLPKEFYPLMEQLQAVDFVLVELTLYLDTHPNDTAAIQQFNETAQYYGPLQQYGNSYSGYPWNWNDSPWPWQL